MMLRVFHVLQDYLKEIVNDEEKSKICKLRVLSRSLAGNMVYLMSITSPYDETQPSKVSASSQMLLHRE